MLHKKFGDSSDIAYIIFTLLFIMCGLAIFSACVNLLVLGYVKKDKYKKDFIFFL